MNFMTSKVYSCGNDARVVKTSLTDNNFFQEFSLTFIPIQLELSVSFKFLYIASNLKEVYVYDADLMEALKVITLDLNSNISTMTVCRSDAIVVGGVSGNICVYTQTHQLIQTFTVAGKVNCIRDWNTKKLIVIGDSNGVVSFWNRNGEKVFT